MLWSGTMEHGLADRGCRHAGEGHRWVVRSVSGLARATWGTREYRQDNVAVGSRDVPWVGGACHGVLAGREVLCCIRSHIP